MTRKFATLIAGIAAFSVICTSLGASRIVSSVRVTQGLGTKYGANTMESLEDQVYKSVKNYVDEKGLENMSEDDITAISDMIASLVQENYGDLSDVELNALTDAVSSSIADSLSASNSINKAGLNNFIDELATESGKGKDTVKSLVEQLYSDGSISDSDVSQISKSTGLAENTVRALANENVNDLSDLINELAEKSGFSAKDVSAAVVKYYLDGNFSYGDITSIAKELGINESDVKSAINKYIETSREVDTNSLVNSIASQTDKSVAEVNEIINKYAGDGNFTKAKIESIAKETGLSFDQVQALLNQNTKTITNTNTSSTLDQDALLKQLMEKSGKSEADVKALLDKFGTDGNISQTEINTISNQLGLSADEVQAMISKNTSTTGSSINTADMMKSLSENSAKSDVSEATIANMISKYAGDGKISTAETSEMAKQLGLTEAEIKALITGYVSEKTTNSDSSVESLIKQLMSETGKSENQVKAAVEKYYQDGTLSGTDLKAIADSLNVSADTVTKSVNDLNSTGSNLVLNESAKEAVAQAASASAGDAVQKIEAVQQAYAELQKSTEDYKKEVEANLNKLNTSVESLNTQMKDTSAQKSTDDTQTGLITQLTSYFDELQSKFESFTNEQKATDNEQNTKIDQLTSKEESDVNELTSRVNDLQNNFENYKTEQANIISNLEKTLSDSNNTYESQKSARSGSTISSINDALTEASTMTKAVESKLASTAQDLDYAEKKVSEIKSAIVEYNKIGATETSNTDIVTSNKDGSQTDTLIDDSTIDMSGQAEINNINSKQSQINSINVLIEDLGRRLNTINTSLSECNANATSISTLIQSSKSLIGTIDGASDSDINAVNTVLSSLNSRVNALQIKNYTDRLNKLYNNIDEINKFSNETTTLAISDLRTHTNTLQNTMSNLKSDISTSVTARSKNTGKSVEESITAANTSASAIDADITKMANELKAIAKLMTDLDSNMTTFENNVSKEDSEFITITKKGVKGSTAVYDYLTKAEAGSADKTGAFKAISKDITDLNARLEQVQTSIATIKSTIQDTDTDLASAKGLLSTADGLTKTQIKTYEDTIKKLRDTTLTNSAKNIDGYVSGKDGYNELVTKLNSIINRYNSSVVDDLVKIEGGLDQMEADVETTLGVEVGTKFSLNGTDKDLLALLQEKSASDVEQLGTQLNKVYAKINALSGANGGQEVRWNDTYWKGGNATLYDATTAGYPFASTVDNSGSIKITRTGTPLTSQGANDWHYIIENGDDGALTNITNEADITIDYDQSTLPPGVRFTYDIKDASVTDDNGGGKIYVRLVGPTTKFDDSHKAKINYIHVSSPYREKIDNEITVDAINGTPDGEKASTTKEKQEKSIVEDFTE